MKETSENTRRDFIKRTIAGAAAVSIAGILPGFSIESNSDIIELKKKYKAYHITTSTVSEIKKVIHSYEAMLLTILQYIIETYKKDPGYQFINTKTDTISGEELHHILGGIDLFGKETIYGWIQGRGLEAIGGHYLWLNKLSSLSTNEKEYFSANSLKILREVSLNLNSFRKKNNNRLSFWMDIEGNAFCLDKNSKKQILQLSSDKVSFSDIFSVKGLIMSARLLGDKKRESEFKSYYKEVIANIKNNRFQTDQEQFDPKNKVAFVPGKISHAPKMIALGMCTLFTQLYKDPQYVEDGLYLVNDIFSRHVNHDLKFGRLKKYDMTEFITPDGIPFEEEGQVVCFPGHVMELTGFTGKFIHVIKNLPDITQKQKADITRICSFLTDFFIHNFRMGFKEGYGMYKSVSLYTRKPINSDMPWWAVPETIRAASYIYMIAPENQKNEILSILADASNVFLNRYVNTNVHCLAYQTLDEFGKPIRVVPATPDADPGYHTGLCIIDFIEVWSEITG